MTEEKQQNSNMEKVAAWPIEGIEMDCPKCGKTIQELGSDPRDMTGYSPSEYDSGEMECPYCGETFEYYIDPHY